MSAITDAKAQWRKQKFKSLDEVMVRVHGLVPDHQTVGAWTLGQICHHLAAALNGSIDGFDLRNHRLKRLFIRKRMLRVALTKGIPRNYTVDPGLTPPADVALLPAVDGLARAIERYRRHDGPLQAHPLFGRMPREVWDRVHLVHCAHHLRFVTHPPGEKRGIANDE